MAQAYISEAPTLSSAVEVLSTAGYLYISLDESPDLKALVNATAGSDGSISGTSGMVKIGKFVSGTFEFDGDEPEITALTYEDGIQFFSTTTSGTESITGEMPNLAPEIMTLFMGATKVDNKSTSASGEYTADSLLLGYDIWATGAKSATLSSRVVMLEFTQGNSFDHMVYPNATVTVSKGGSGSSDGTVNLVFNISASAAEGSSVPTDIQGNNILWLKKKTA